MSRTSINQVVALLLLAMGPSPARAAAGPSVEEARAALKQAATFFHDHVATHNGYVWRVSGDLALREGEGTAGPTTVWAQPPGTPTIGLAYLTAYEATGDALYRDYARDTAQALLFGQLASGGWYYSIQLGPDDRAKVPYRLDLDGRLLTGPVSKADRDKPGGWSVWKTRKYKNNLSMLDDNTTQACVLFLIRLDKALDFKDRAVSQAARRGLDALLGAQYPNGAWSASFDRFPAVPPSEVDYPIKRATFPAEWSRTWTKDFTGCYVTNDNLIADAIATMLEAHSAYGDPRALASAERAGRFLIDAQMPEPQPAWAQQYDRDMVPVWSRKFEPPAISGLESQGIMEALIALALRTRDAAYLAPIPRAIAYLRRSALPDGRLARFYELKTNKPLYFTRDYVLTYNNNKMPKHYGFMVPSNLDRIERAYAAAQQALAGGTGVIDRPNGAGDMAALARAAQAAISSLDPRGAWVEKGRLDSHEIEPQSGIIHSTTFAKNVAALADFIRAAQAARQVDQ